MYCVFLMKKVFTLPPPLTILSFVNLFYNNILVSDWLSSDYSYVIGVQSNTYASVYSWRIPDFREALG